MNLPLPHLWLGPGNRGGAALRCGITFPSLVEPGTVWLLLFEMAILALSLSPQALSPFHGRLSDGLDFSIVSL